MGGSLRFILTLFLAVLVSAPAEAEKRIALVIGNSAYKNVAKLSNPANDAAAMATMLKSAGFDIVESKFNTSAAELRKSLREFTGKSREADVAVIYYAGHGIEMDGTNYLIPVDAVLESDSDLLDEGISLERVLYVVEPAKQLRLIILDACRDNPFARTMRRTVVTRAVGRGLAKVEPASPNTMIAFAAKAGSTATDGDSTNSPYAAALVEYLPKPGLDLRRAFGFVRDDVLRITNNKQEPYVYGSLGGNDIPLVPAKPVEAVGPQADPNASIRKDYELSLQLGTTPAWQAFLAQYPDGFYANLAKGQLDKIAAEEARLAAVEKARQAEQEKARLAAEGAKQAEQAKAAAAAKAAEEQRIAAEKAKQLEQDKAAAAERARLAEQDRLAAEKAAQEMAAAEKARLAAEEKRQQVAAVQPSSDAKLSPSELITSLQLELRRVGCLSALATGDWSASSERSLSLFNKYAGTKLDIKAASLNALDVVKAKTSRICPLICDSGYRPDGDHCAKIVCRSGHRVNESGECVKIEVTKSRAKREEATERQTKSEAVPTRPQATGQVFCDQQGCRPVKKGCSVSVGLPVGSTARARHGAGGQIEVCN